MKTGDWVLLIATVIGGGGISSLVGSLAVPLIRRPAVRAEATERLTGAASVLVDQLQEEVARARMEAQGARTEAREASQEAAAARRSVHALSSEVDELTDRLRRMISWIHEPTMTLSRLRMLVPGPPKQSNGTGQR